MFRDVQRLSSRAPAPRELLSRCVATYARDARANSAADPRAEDRMHEANRQLTKVRGRSAWRLPGIGQPLLRCLNSGIHALAISGKSTSRSRASRPSFCPVGKEQTSVPVPATRRVDRDSRRAGVSGKATARPALSRRAETAAQGGSYASGVLRHGRRVKRTVPDSLFPTHCSRWRMSAFGEAGH